MSTADSNALLRRFWEELGSIRTGMLGLVDAREALAQPMTAHFEGTAGPLWFYARSDGDIAQAIERNQRAVFHYVGADHGLYACVHGTIAIDRDASIIRRYWSDDVVRWFPGGPDDNAVTLLRFEPAHAQIWLPAETDQRADVELDTSSPVDVRATAEV